jgi:SAM-dependent methyltransferase
MRGTALHVGTRRRADVHAGPDPPSRTRLAGRVPEMVAAAKWVCTSKPYRLVAQRVVLPWALNGVRPAGQALEIGAGSGAMAAQLLTRYPALSLVISDYDAGMIKTAREGVSAFGERVAVLRADAVRLPFSDDRFDLVFSFAMLHHVGDWPRAVREAMRVLRPGGSFIGYDPLEGPLTRLLHCGEGNAVRMMRRGQLDVELARMPATDVRTSTSFGGLVVRFAATKTHRGSA